MSSPANPPDAVETGANTAGVLAGSEGVILQRGGEELALEKVSDRFTVRLCAGASATDLAQQLSAHQNRTVSNAQLEEFIVNPDQLDRAMETARAADAVDFVSHIYQIQKNPGTFVYLTNQVNVQFAPQVPAATIEAIASAGGLRQLQPVGGIPNTFVFQVTQQATENPVKIANRLMRYAEVLIAEPNVVIQTQQHYQPRDPLYPKQWYLNHKGGPDLAVGSHIAVEKAWDITRGSRSVVVAIVDDSVDLNHPDFQGKGKIVAPRDLKTNDFLPLPEEPEDNHGTACAGVAIAEENGSGMVGVAPGCALMPIRTTGFLDDEAIEQIFEWAVTNGAAVISCSWGPSAVYFPLSLRQRAALTRAATEGRNGKGCVVVFAAGNANRPVNGTLNENGWPKNIIRGITNWLGGFTVHPDVVTVSACTSLNKKAAYSNWGTNVAVCAPSNNAPPGMWLQETGFIATPPEIQLSLPGEGIFTSDRLGAEGYDPENFTSTFGGTSSACPVVAGVAALVLSVNPDLTAQDVKQILQQTADKIVDSDPDPQLGIQQGTYDASGHSQWFGYGKVNAAKAVQAAQRQISIPLTASRQVQGRNDTPITIPDYDTAGITSTIQLRDPGAVRDIQVSVNIEHSFMGDVEVSLMAPTGQVVLLQSRSLGRTTQLQTTYSLRTTPLLRHFLNQPAAGLWQLLVVDYALLNTGTLKGWQLSLGV